MNGNPWDDVIPLAYILRQTSVSHPCSEKRGVEQGASKPHESRHSKMCGKVHCTARWSYLLVRCLPYCLSLVIYILILPAVLFPRQYVPFSETTCFNTFYGSFRNKSCVISYLTFCLYLSHLT